MVALTIWQMRLLPRSPPLLCNAIHLNPGGQQGFRRDLTTRVGRGLAKRVECAQLAGAVEWLIGIGQAKAGASSTRSIRFARFGGGCASLCPQHLWGHSRGFRLHRHGLEASNAAGVLRTFLQDVLDLTHFCAGRTRAFLLSRHQVHGSDIGPKLLARVLRQAGVERTEWERL